MIEFKPDFRVGDMTGSTDNEVSEIQFAKLEVIWRVTLMLFSSIFLTKLKIMIDLMSQCEYILILTHFIHLIPYEFLNYKERVEIIFF